MLRGEVSILWFVRFQRREYRKEGNARNTYFKKMVSEYEIDVIF